MFDAEIKIRLTPEALKYFLRLIMHTDWIAVVFKHIISTDNKDH